MPLDTLMEGGVPGRLVFTVLTAEGKPALQHGFLSYEATS
jgi:hypothetical protein